MRKKAVIKKIGKENWEKFYAWMRGQTCGIYKDGATNFYSWDVSKFIDKIHTGYDSQEHVGWD